jgi:hypothetical protein
MRPFSFIYSAFSLKIRRVHPEVHPHLANLPWLITN